MHENPLHAVQLDGQGGEETDKEDKAGDDILSQYANFNDESLTSDPLRQYFMQQLADGTVKKWKEADEIDIPNMPSVTGYRKWKLNMIKKVVGASGRPDEAILWVGKVAFAKSWEELSDSGPTWASLDAKWAQAKECNSDSE